MLKSCVLYNIIDKNNISAYLYHSRLEEYVDGVIYFHPDANFRSGVEKYWGNRGLPFCATVVLYVPISSLMELNLRMGILMLNWVELDVSMSDISTLMFRSLEHSAKGVYGPNFVQLIQ